MQKKPLTLFQKILTGLMSAMLIMLLSDVLLQYFFGISLEVGLLIIPLAAVGLVSLFVFYPEKKPLAWILFCIISGFGIIFYHFTKESVSEESVIADSDYAIRVHPHGYQIIRYYDFAKKTAAEKNSAVFFNPNSKTGTDRNYQVNILKETPESLYIEIHAGTRQVDRLKKRTLWEQTEK